MDRQLCRSQWCQSALADGWWQTIWLCVSQRLEYRSLSFEHLNEESVPGRFEPTKKKKKNICRTTRLHKICPFGTEKPMVSGSLRGWLYQCNINIINRDEAKHLVCINPSLWACFLFRLLDPGNTRRVSETSPASYCLRINLWHSRSMRIATGQEKTLREQYQNL